MGNLKERPQNWDMGWCVIQIERTNWIIVYNGHPVESEFASERDALDKAYLWETEMAEQWRKYA
tara:strand:- start:250 stop:441 length:192 start_codon:yes stop_codon:yes gene_type:complete